MNRVTNFTIAALGVAALGVFGTSLSAQRPEIPESPDPRTAELETIPVQGNVSLLAGAGGNITVQSGDDGLVLVDSGLEAFSDRLATELKKVSSRPVRAIINTGTDADHIGGNDNLAKTGIALYQAMNSGGVTIPGAQLMGHEDGVTVLGRPGPGGSGTVASSKLWPFDTFFGPLKTVYANGESISILHQPAANTMGNVIVVFRRSDVVSAGDLIHSTRYPKWDPQNGGSLQGILDGLNNILDITVPEFNQQGGTRVIPGHGRIMNESDVVEYRDMVTIIKERIQLLVKQGKTLDQVKAAKVSLAYDGLYGSTKGSWTTDMFIEAAYRELSKPTR